MSDKILMRQEDGSYVLEMPQETQPRQAQLEQLGFVENIARTDIAGIPVGGALTGAVVIELLDKLVGSTIAGWGIWGNLVLAWAAKQFGSRWLGSRTADSAALLLTYAAVQPMVSDLLNKVWPGTVVEQPHALSGGGIPVSQSMASSSMEQMPATSSDYYAMAFARGG